METIVINNIRIYQKTIQTETQPILDNEIENDYFGIKEIGYWEETSIVGIHTKTAQLDFSLYIRIQFYEQYKNNQLIKQGINDYNIHNVGYLQEECVTYNSIHQKQEKDFCKYKVGIIFGKEKNYKIFYYPTKSELLEYMNNENKPLKIENKYIGTVILGNTIIGYLYK